MKTLKTIARSEDKRTQEHSDGKFTWKFIDNELVGFKVNGTGYRPAVGLKSSEDILLIENQMWGTNGKDGKSPLINKPLKSLAHDHINNILNDYVDGKYKVNILYINYFKFIIGIPNDFNEETT